MIVIDWVIALIVGYNMLVGMFRGFVRMILDLIALGLSVFVAFRFQNGVTDALMHWIPISSVIGHILGVLVLWLLVYAVVMLLAKALDSMVSWMAMGPINALAGLALGAIRGVLMMLPIVLIWQFIDPTVMQQSVILHTIFVRN